MRKRTPQERPAPPGKRAASTAAETTIRTILETAERLFALRGYGGTSLRHLTAEAGVNLAAVNYHFGTKEGLLRAVLARRLDGLNSIRLDRFRKIRSRAGEKGDRPQVAEVLQAFIAPMFLLVDAGEDARSFTRLIGRILTDQDPPTMDIFIRYMKPVFQECHELLRLALPGVPPKTLFWRLVFALGAASRVMHLDEGLTRLDRKHARLRDTEALLSLLLPFVTAGMEAK